MAYDMTYYDMLQDEIWIMLFMIYELPFAKWYLVQDNFKI